MRHSFIPILALIFDRILLSSKSTLGMSARSFRRASCHVLDKAEVADFTHKVFNLFDGDGDAFLNFEEFTLAVEVKDTTGNPLGKLAWLFDSVYDKVSKTFLNKQEV